MGCWAACVAFLMNINYEKALLLFEGGFERAKLNGVGLHPIEMAKMLTERGHETECRYVNRGVKRVVYLPGTIVFLKKSKTFPYGHYLCKTNIGWMDPWINLSQTKDVTKAKAGFRKKLPGKPIYALLVKKVLK